MNETDPAAIPPTSRLPSVTEIPSETLDSLDISIQYLRSIYNPEVRGSRRRQKSSHFNGRITPAAGASTQLAAALNYLRADSFERAYSIRWLTALISTLDAADDDELNGDSQEKERTVQNAAALLAACAGTSATGNVVRDFTFTYHVPQNGDSEPPEFIPITTTIADLPLDNDDFGSVGVQTWGGACVLSEMLVEDPGAFGISADQLNYQKQSMFRVLELGAGTGLVTLTAAKLLQKIALGVTCRVQIVATDYYPPVLENLRANVRANIHADANSSITVLTHSLDWSRFGPGDTKVQPFNQPFDLVFGADVIYEPEHAAWIRSCLAYLLRKPSDSSRPECPKGNAFFHLVSPLRATHSFESNSIETVFSRGEDDVSNPSLQVLAKDTLICDAETGEEVEYAYYKIGWI